MAKVQMFASSIPHTPSHNRADTNALRSPGWLAQRPLMGFTLFLLGALVFGALAYNVKTHGPLLQWDVLITNALHAQAEQTPNSINEFILFGFFVGKELVEVSAWFLILYFIYKRFWREIAMIIIGWGGEGALWYFLTRYFDRHRPLAQIGIVVTDPSFPSGHTATAVLAFGMIAYMLVPLMPSRFWKWVVVLIAIAIMLFIGFSRLFLGGHYLTDLIAGYALGLAWGALVYTLLEKYA
jgi:membrane-associated phospholipid phosphatase